MQYANVSNDLFLFVAGVDFQFEVTKNDYFFLLYFRLRKLGRTYFCAQVLNCELSDSNPGTSL